MIEPDCPRPVRRGLRLFADQIRRSEFARAVMTHAPGRRNSQCTGFHGERVSGALLPCRRKFRLWPRSLCASIACVYIVCVCIAARAYRATVCRPQVLVDFHEGIVRRRARPLQRVWNRVGKLYARNESSVARLDGQECPSRHKQTGQPGTAVPHGPLFVTQRAKLFAGKTRAMKDHFTSLIQFSADKVLN